MKFRTVTLNPDPSSGPFRNEVDAELTTDCVDFQLFAESYSIVKVFDDVLSECHFERAFVRRVQCRLARRMGKHVV
jgi:hypothetical protein